jgi:hypothetical protein
MIHDSPILQEPEIPEVINDMNRSHKMRRILLPNLDILMLAHVKPVQVDPRTFQEQVLITAKLLVIPIVQLQVPRLELPNVIPQVVSANCVLEIVVVREVLFGM